MGQEEANHRLELLDACHADFKCLSDPTRRQILIALVEKDSLNVGQITERTHLSQPAISHHLKELRLADLVEMRSVGNENFYHANLDPFMDKLKKLLQEWET